ncbi:hypothetical protein QTP88_005731 [Uroleucon formosanum]
MSLMYDQRNLTVSERSDRSFRKKNSVFKNNRFVCFPVETLKALRFLSLNARMSKNNLITFSLILFYYLLLQFVEFNVINLSFYIYLNLITNNKQLTVEFLLFGTNFIIFMNF